MPSVRERTLAGTSELSPLPATNAFQPATKVLSLRHENATRRASDGVPRVLMIFRN